MNTTYLSCDSGSSWFAQMCKGAAVLAVAALFAVPGGLRAQEADWRDVDTDPDQDWSVEAEVALDADQFDDSAASDLFGEGESVFEGLTAEAADSSPRMGFAPGVSPPKPLPQRVLVELFSSQGCSACPPADAMLADLAQRDDVLPVALHIDYWDYLGLADSFARPQFTARQEAYARRDGARSVYTPQFVIGGATSPEAPRPTSVLEGISAQPGPVVRLSHLPKDGQLVLRLESLGQFPRAASVGILTYRPKVGLTISAGENRGRQMTYVNVLRGWTEIAKWDGEVALRIMLREEAFADPGERLALVVQDLLPGPGGRLLPGRVLGAAALPE